MTVEIKKDKRFAGCYWIYSEENEIIASILALDVDGYIQGRNEYKLELYKRPFDSIDFVKDNKDDYCTCLHVGTLPKCKKLAQQL